MPVRPSRSLPNGPDMRIHDRFRFGGLVEIAMLDGRQYRSREACYGPPDHGGGHVESDAACPERRDPDRSLLGREQEQWLYDGLTQSRACWNLLAQDVLMAQLRQRNHDGEIQFWVDDWNGYPAARQRLINHLHNGRISNPVVLSGDIHSFWANDLKLDFDDAASPVVATEFVGTSVSAHPPPYDMFVKFLPDNPHVRYFESRKRGYTMLEVDAERITARFRSLVDATIPNTEVETLQSFVVESGRPGAVPA
jgi:alkaline phosphatase D